uniref:SKI-interacting protein SKIP SNW domain-containing protein n=1 Tax=Globisporangium ultimum (strain ATCC 200006 / CBS 805.95 / DAOM BR144) TaxID=431595 RepID=K3X5F7_GLOUD
MSALFPAPVHAYTTYADDAPASASNAPSSPLSNTTGGAAGTRRAAAVPPYPQRVAKKFIPRSAEDFGDGGAYPEIHLAQFPLNMGKKGGKGSGGGTLSANSSNNTLALQVRGDDGGVGYDAVVTQHHRNKTKVYTKFSDMVEKDAKADGLALPTKDEEIETANRTKDALQALVQGKIAASLPVNVSRQKTAKESSTYIRYTPNDQGKMGGQSQQRIIRMVEVAKDPMEPPKFQHRKAVRGPPSPPVPVLHSPPRKLTVKDQQSWKIPPMISNWKNSKGFTIALDKRLAADGRGLQQVTVNDNFASLSEALAIAERKAREEVNMRATVQKKLAMKQKEQKENELRELASKARMERSGISRGEEEYNDRDDRDDDRSRHRHRSRDDSDRSDSEDDRDRRRRYSDDRDDDDDDARGRRERDRIRRDRKKERERELRMQKIGKKGKLTRDEDRDVSEKIALGQLQGAGKLSGDALFDSRLFNQSQGISSGFGADDDYTVYSKPLVDRGKASVYRPKGEDGGFGDADTQVEELKQGHTKRFKADKQFQGTKQVGHGRDGPVQFSYDDTKDDDDEEDDRRGSRGRGRSPPPRSLTFPLAVVLAITDTWTSFAIALS